MRNFFTALVIAMFLLPAVAKAEAPSLTTVWDFSVNNGGTLPAHIYPYAWNSSQRSMAVKDGKIYITNNAADKKIAVVDATTGLLIETLELSFLPESADRWLKNCIRFTEDGYAIIGSSGTGSHYFTFTICDLDQKTLIKKVTVQTQDIGRTDYFSTYGKLYGEESEGGYVVVASIAGNITTIPMFDGTISTEAVLPFLVSGAYTNGTSVIPIIKDADSFFVVGRSIQRALYNIGGSTEVIPSSLIPNSANSGASYFNYNGKEYLAIASDNISAFKILDVTDGAANATLAMDGNFALGVTNNASQTVITTIETEVFEDYTMIYVLSVGNGMAAYKFVTEKQVVEVVETPVIAPESGSYSEGVTVTISTTTPGATIRYTLDGTEPTETSTEYTAPFVVTKPLVDSGSTDVTVKAKAWLAGWTASDVAEMVYTFTTVGIEDDEASVLKVYTSEGQVIVDAEVVADVEIYNIQGQKVVSDKAVQNATRYSLEKGIYIVKVLGKSIKVVL